MVPHTPLSSAHRTSPDRSVLAAKQLEFLGTKVIPPRYSGLIVRPRLLGLAAQLLTKRLAVIKAPAGFGKSSLASAWAEQFQRTGNLVAWLTIDPDDNEPTQFLFYVAQALRSAHEEIGARAIALINETTLINPHAVVSTLINDLMDIDEEVYLFLEDYHWVSDPGIHDAVGFFIRHAPSHCHLIFVTRTEPPLPLASLRAQNQLLDIDADALRFDLNETRDFKLRAGRPSCELWLLRHLRQNNFLENMCAAFPARSVQSAHILTRCLMAFPTTWSSSCYALQYWIDSRRHYAMRW